LTTRDVDPDEPENTVSPEYVPVIVLLPGGAAAERHEPKPPLIRVATQSRVDPDLNVTEPLGVGIPPTPAVTVAE
jgi:hypothetical protein